MHIFPEAMRGVGDGHRGWDLQPSSTMTNGSVEQTAASSDGQMLTLKYKDGEKKIVVPPGIPIVVYVPGEVSELKAGATHLHQRGQQAAGRHAAGAARQRRPAASLRPCKVSCPLPLAGRVASCRRHASGMGAGWGAYKQRPVTPAPTPPRRGEGDR